MSTQLLGAIESGFYKCDVRFQVTFHAYEHPTKRLNSEREKEIQNKKHISEKNYTSLSEKFFLLTCNMAQYAYGEEDSSDTSNESSEENESDDSDEDRLKVSKKRKRVDNNEIVARHVVNMPFLPSNLTELIALAKGCKDNFFRDTTGLFEALKPLERLNEMIGQHRTKQQIFEMIVRALQSHALRSVELKHMLLIGVPGIGKSTLLGYLAEILACIGATKQNKIVFGHMPTDFIAGALGQTALKTSRMFKSAKGGLLVIDEIQNIADNRHQYSSDSYSKSCADTMTSFLTDETLDVLVIGCGYAHEIKRDFLSLNSGLESRFPTIIKMDTYTPAELKDIALLKIKQRGLTFDVDATLDISLFEHPTLFRAFGRSVSSFVEKIVTALALRVFGQEIKTVLVKQDIEKGFVMFQTNMY
jgi:SpoVK/Ycf46/Vps4 family AAA+-type ATPase